MANIENEKRVVAKMIHLYCRKHNHEKPKGAPLCEECEKLAAYAALRLDKCRYANEKPRCQNCTTHCYGASQREKIRQVMREIGPWMIVKMPIGTLKYLLRIK